MNSFLRNVSETFCEKLKKAMSKQPCWPLILRGGHADGLGFALPLHGCITLSLLGHSPDGRPTIRNPPNSPEKRLKMGPERPKIQCVVGLQSAVLRQASPNGKLRNGPKRMRSTRERRSAPTHSQQRLLRVSERRAGASSIARATRLTPNERRKQAPSFLAALAHYSDRAWLLKNRNLPSFLPVTTLPNPTIICHYAKQCVKKNLVKRTCVNSVIADSCWFLTEKTETWKNWPLFV